MQQMSKNDAACCFEQFELKTKQGVRSFSFVLRPLTIFVFPFFARDHCLTTW